MQDSPRFYVNFAILTYIYAVIILLLTTTSITNEVNEPFPFLSNTEEHNSIKGFSAAWLLFYSISVGILWPMNNTEE